MITGASHAIEFGMDNKLQVSDYNNMQYKTWTHWTVDCMDYGLHGLWTQSVAIFGVLTLLCW